MVVLITTVRDGHPAGECIGEETQPNTDAWRSACGTTEDVNEIGVLDIIGMVSTTDALQTRDELGYFSKQGMKIRDENKG